MKYKKFIAQLKRKDTNEVLYQVIIPALSMEEFKENIELRFGEVVYDGWYEERNNTNSTTND